MSPGNICSVDKRAGASLVAKFLQGEIRYLVTGRGSQSMRKPALGDLIWASREVNFDGTYQFYVMINFTKKGCALGTKLKLDLLERESISG